MSRHSLLVLLCAIASPATGQTASVGGLGPPTATFTERFRATSFNRLLEPARTIKELRDGRIVVQIDRRLYLGDPVSGRVSPLPDFNGTLIALPGDTSVVAERGRWRFLVGTTVVGGLPSSNPIVTFMREGLLSPEAFDAQGFVYTELFGRRRGDSLSLVRIDRATGERAMIATLAPPVTRRGLVCMDAERATVFPDGAVAVLRRDPYRVDWLSATAQWTRGAPIAYTAVRFTERERSAFLQWEGSDRARYEPQLTPSEMEWPEYVCPWHSGFPPLAMPDGRLLVYRVPTAASSGTTYDIINRRGTVDRRLQLAANKRVIGFGASTIYVITADSAGHILTRHGWP